MLIDFTADPRKAYGWMSSAIAPRPIAWVCTRSRDGVVNLAPFSFFQMVTGTPPTLMISPLLQGDGSLKDTTRNIIETGEFVVNLVPHSLREKMNETSFSFPANVSEIEQCGIATFASARVKPPRVVGVPVSFECRVASVLPYPADKPSCHIILGEVLVAHIDERVLDEQGRIDPRRLDSISRMGGDWYGRIDSNDNFLMARPQGWDKPAPVSGQPTPQPMQHAVPPAMSDAVRLHAATRFAEAEVIYRQILANDPTQPDATGMLGWLLFQTGQHETGLQLMCKAVDAQPRNPIFHRNLGAALRDVGKLDAAFTHGQHALAYAPDYAEAHFDVAECYRMQNMLVEAEQAYWKALYLKPDYADAWVHLGLAQQTQHKFEEAKTSIGNSLVLSPLSPQAHMNLGAVFHALDQQEQAILSYRRALLVDPQLATAYYNQSIALTDVGRRQEAEQASRRAITIDPGYVDAHFQLANLLLKKGDFANGWREYEYRWLLKGAHKIVVPQAPLWDGVSDLRGKTILIHVEQGHGDTLQFARYAQLLAERGAIVWVAVPDNLRTLMQRCVGVSAVFCGPDELLPGYDCHCPMLSLPLVLHTELHNIPADVPYLFCDPDAGEQWRQRVATSPAMRVGLVWAGGRHNNEAMAYAIDRLRSVHFDQLKPLLGIAGVEFFSLQIGEEARAQMPRQARIKDFTDSIHDFDDTATLIDHLDLVISVDTAVAHLAGALGKPIWMLNRFNSCWRWLPGRSDSPWYPTMRIFTQSSFGDWDNVIDDVTQALRELVETRMQSQPMNPMPDNGLAISVDLFASELRQALGYHQAGDLVRAEALYRQILAVQPRHADALHYLGMLAYQRGGRQEAIDLIRQAIEVNLDNPLYHHNLGTIYRQGGDLPASIASYRQAIALKDDYVDAHYKLAISYQQARQLPDAEQSYRKVIELVPGNAGAHNNLGSVLREMGRFAAAEESYRQALRIKPDFADAHLNFGNLLKDGGRLAEAEQHYRAALNLQPDYSVHCNLGVLLAQQERYQEAEQSYLMALALQPESLEILNNLGFAMVDQHRYVEAEHYFRKALQLHPEFAEAHNNLGIVLREQQKFDEAEGAFRKAIEIRPTLRVAHNHLGNLLKQAFRFEEARDVYARAVELDPEDASAHSNLGVLMQEMNSPIEAEAHLRRALQVDSNFGFAHHNLAIVLRDQGRIEEAQASCLRAIEIDPEHMEAQFHYAFLLLQKGDFHAGWRQFEYRWQLDSADQALDLFEPHWDGKADIAGKKVLLYAEQGYGDTLQMCRYARLVAERGAEVLLLVPPELRTLMARCTGVKAAFSSVSEVPRQFDYQVPLMSLPLHFNTTLDSIPADIAYLSSDPALRHHWQVLIGKPEGLRVGLVWAGNPRKQFPGAQIIDRQRSLHCDQLKSLLDIDRVDFFSLQIGEEARAQLSTHTKVKDFTGLIQDFGDTAALIDNLDLVITVDTSVAHLAGALGKPVWMLNRFNGCWRWLLNRDDSPWYPTMRIFTQHRFGDWQGVIESVTQALNEFVGTTKSAQVQAADQVADRNATNDVAQFSSVLQQALAYHQAGRLSEAEALYRQILATEPRHADVLHYRGMLAHQSGRRQEAIDLIRQAIEANGDNPLYHYNLGTIYRQGGDLLASIASYQQALALKDDYVDAHHKLGIAYQQSAQPLQAELCYRRVIALTPNNVGAHNNLGSVLQEMGRLNEAEASYRQALRIKPDFVDAYLNFGNLLRDSSRLRDAEMHYRMALELAPNNAQVHSNLGVLMARQERFDEAEQCYSKGLSLQPDSVEIRNNLGFAAAEQHRFGEAEQIFLSVLQLRPEFAEAYNNLGIVLREQDRLDASEDAFRKSLQLNPSQADAYNNLGNLLSTQQRLDEAEACYLHALHIRPDYHNAHLNYSFVLLQRGDFTKGWKEHEHRWHSAGFESLRSYAQPLWDGKSDLHGKAMLVHAEQGLGDTLQFIRYAELLKERGATVYALVPESLKSLLSSCAGVTAVIVPGDPLPEFDLHCPLISLPLAFGTEVATIPAKMPYLTASEISIERWRKLLGKKTALRVGLVWAGSPRKNQLAAQLVDRRRSMHFNAIKSLLNVQGIQFVSLQLGDDARAQIDATVPLLDLADELRDFEETAALIANLDLVISVDTSVAHLAGALGKPVWMLNRYNTCWRWFSDRSDSPWYPSMRIFRQATMGDWQGVIADARAALEQWAKKSNIDAPPARVKRKKKR